MRVEKHAAVVALCWAAAVCEGAAAQDEPASEAGDPASPAVDVDIEEEIIVRGTTQRDLRIEIQLAEEAVLERFNEINSDDRFDIVCRYEPVIGSKLDRRICRSNSWREQDTNFAQSTLAEIRGEMGPPSQQFRIEQQVMQGRLYDEMRRLIYEDEALYDAIQRLGRAKLALAEHNGRGEDFTVSREIRARDGELPYGAKRMIEVQIGRDRFSHRLAEPTFEIAHVTGDVRRLEVECDQGRERLKYEGEVSWTLPPDWSACTLRVDAKRGATFTLYEFE